MNASRDHILLIDDDRDIHHAVKLILESAGYRVSCHATGPAGVEALRREPPDLVLLDIMLASPEEGLELAAELRQDDRLSRIPVIMLSSIGRHVCADWTGQTASGRAAASGFLEKPLAAQTLLTAVREALKSEK